MLHIGRAGGRTRSLAPHFVTLLLCVDRGFVREILIKNRKRTHYIMRRGWSICGMLAGRLYTSGDLAKPDPRNGMSVA